ncbi:hypothetical protein ACF0H5_004809 [Mactra antiquata]
MILKTLAMSEHSQLNWDCEMEVNLFHALRGHKPVGVNKHFHMVSIHEKLASSYKKITAEQIWAYLGELYDLNALNESEIIPFPNKQNEFDLPDDFTDLQSKSFPRLKLDGDKSDSRGDKQSSTNKGDKTDIKTEKNIDSVLLKSLKSDSRQSVGTPTISTPDNSPKRKRTRHTPSTASPATPDAPPPKRRR